ncbi:MAG: hypothetical protein H5T41_02230 [Methanomassiliicoccales archaeon]|nr:hypothetical protein [Methanomassiliicoccales archaeon]
MRTLQPRLLQGAIADIAQKGGEGVDVVSHPAILHAPSSQGLKVHQDVLLVNLLGVDVPHLTLFMQCQEVSVHAPISAIIFLPGRCFKDALHGVQVLVDRHHERKAAQRPRLPLPARSAFFSTDEGPTAATTLRSIKALGNDIGGRSIKFHLAALTDQIPTSEFPANA